MKDLQKRLIYSDDLDTMYGSEEERLAMYKEANDIPEEEEVDENEIIEWSYNSLHHEYDSLLSDIRNSENPVCLCMANIGTWQGRRAGGKIGKLDELISSAMADYNDIYHNTKDGTLEIKATHHDGTSYYAIMPLTKKGEEYWERHYYDDPGELHLHLYIIKGYTKRFKTIWS